MILAADPLFRRVLAIEVEVMRDMYTCTCGFTPLNVSDTESHSHDFTIPFVNLERHDRTKVLPVPDPKAKGVQ